MRLFHKNICVLFFALSTLAFGQELDRDLPQATSLHEALSQGEVHGEIRNFFMNTINREELKDYYTNALGFALKYETKPFYGFSMGGHFRSVFRTLGSRLSKEDDMLGTTAKWEYELYDLLNPGRYKDINKLQELYLKYQFNQSYISLGRLETEYTPLLNNSDGRMGPFAHQGLWLHHPLNAKSTLDLGFINGVSPRSVTDWFSINQSVGLFFNGFLPNGEEANYRGTTNSQGIGIAKYQFNQANWNFVFYDIFIHQLLNTVWLESDYTLKNWNLGLQYVYQHGADYQRQLPLANQYIRDGENGQVLSTQLAWKKADWQFSIAYSKLFDTGRLLFPKEIGRDRFYTSIPRSRMEGLGDADVIVLKTQKFFPRTGLDFLLEFQSIQGPSLNDFNLNKYNIDETYQFNTIINYDGSQLLKGLSFEGLFVFRYNKNETADEVIFNKSNFIQLNFMTYFRF
jgi:hypothetical protein